jgi:hypothetical protein
MAIVGEWIPQSGFKGKADANKVAQEVESIGYNNNTDEFNTQEMVDYARNNPTSELHKLFEWNDTVAAELYRNQQAKDILRFLKITIIKQEEDTTVKQPTLTRYFVNTGKRDGTYKKTEIVFQNASEADRVLENMRRDAENFINRYKIYANLNPNIPSAIAALQTIINP